MHSCMCVQVSLPLTVALQQMLGCMLTFGTVCPCNCVVQWLCLQRGSTWMTELLVPCAGRSFNKHKQSRTQGSIPVVTCACQCACRTYSSRTNCGTLLPAGWLPSTVTNVTVAHLRMRRSFISQSLSRLCRKCVIRKYRLRQSVIEVQPECSSDCF